jgi:hypothetical protein
MEDKNKIRDKIKKLLALGQSPNENEARDAILLARKLMIKHKMSEADITDHDASKMVHQTCDIKWTTDSGEIWITDICRLISDNYCCVSAWNHQHGTRTYKLVLTGMENDLQVCKDVIEYAVGFVRGRIKIQQKKYFGDPKTIATSYAKGFVSGLEMAFEDQDEKEEQENQNWALVVQKPEEVQKYADSLGSRNVKTRKTQFDPLAYMKGQNDGRNFSANKVLQGT